MKQVVQGIERQGDGEESLCDQSQSFEVDALLMKCALAMCI